MHIFCSTIVLIFINGCYAIACFNMESIVAPNSDEEIAATISPADLSSDLDLADLLDLDIFDFDVDELTERNDERRRLSTHLHRTEDRMSA